jgi:hypothetical protein
MSDYDEYRYHLDDTGTCLVAVHMDEEPADLIAGIEEQTGRKVIKFEWVRELPMSEV